MDKIQGVAFAITPEWVLDAQVSDRAVRLFGVLARYVGGNDRAWPSRKTLAERLGCSVDSVDRAVAELTAIEALSVEPHFRDDRSQTSSTYYLYPAAPVPRGGRKDAEGGAAPVPPLEGESVVTKVSEGTTTTKRGRPSTVGYSSQFEDLWLIYPRKVNKAGAWKAYKARLCAGIGEADLYAAALEYAKQRKNQDEEYTMYGSTFFGPNDRWRDYMPKPAWSMDNHLRAAAEAYDDWDERGMWKWGTGWTGDHPITKNVERPIDPDGNFVDGKGGTYRLNAAGERVGTDYWKD